MTDYVCSCHYDSEVRLATGRSSLIFVHRCSVHTCCFLNHISYILQYLTLPVLDAAASAPLYRPRHMYMHCSIPRSRPTNELDETVGHLCGIGVLSDMGQEASIRTGGADCVLADRLWERDGVRDRHPRQGELSECESLVRRSLTCRLS